MKVEHVAPMAGRRRAGGFTLIEILIAIVVLVVGLVGILALFPTALEWGKKTVQDTYAAMIAESVKDAISVGLKKNLHTLEQGNVRVSFFIFQHDGLPQDARDELLTIDDLDQPGTLAGIVGDPFCIVLPTDYTQDNRTATYIYPKPREHFQTSFPGPDKITDDDGRYDNVQSRIPILDAYRLSEALPEQQARDPYGQYSYAFQITRAKIDTDGPGNKPDGRITAQDRFSNELFEVRVFIFRNFVETAEHERNRPIAEFTTYISL